MRYRVRIDDRWYDVEIADLYARPVRTLVDGEPFDVWPEEEKTGVRAGSPSKGEDSPNTLSKPPAVSARPSPLSSRENGASGSLGEGAQKVLRAPIPGVIVSIAVQPEDEVIPGQELFVLEAMKMKNSIRAARGGRVAAVGVAVGEHVKHNQVLVEFTS
jgi:biotin carboxyl carrier protein